MDVQDRLDLARKALKGIAIGDAFGESFFGETDLILAHIAERNIPASSWEFTDDTVMGLAIWEELEVDGGIDQARLAQKFAHNYALDNRRGYGGTAHKILREIGEGAHWQAVSQAVFDGMGSMGNGASMRVAPIGAYWADDETFAQVAALARASAEVTHYNSEGIAGAIAVACAAALAARIGAGQVALSPDAFIRTVAEVTPSSDLQSRLRVAATLPASTHIETLKTVLGNGAQIIAKDTVPFAIWCAAHHLDDFEEALWHAVSALGDRDTICAIVGSIVILSCDPATVPVAWANAVEDVETSVFRTR
jgi:ADP-ribosylglycohydrolase